MVGLQNHGEIFTSAAGYFFSMIERETVMLTQSIRLPSVKGYFYAG
jgi:hypothetical protein